MNTFRAMSLRRRLLAGALALSLLGTGIASLAVVTDTLNVTSNISAVSVDIQGSINDGGTYTQAVTLDWLVQSGTVNSKAVRVKNFGNVNATLSFSATATGTASITNASFELYEVVSLANCPALGSGVGTIKTGANSKVGTPVWLSGASGQIGPIAPLATTYVCLTIAGLAVAPGDAAVQTLVITATSP